MIRQAVVLNGGQGKRLRPYTDDQPKGMVEVGGKSIFAWQLAWLVHHGVRNIIVSAGYRAEIFEAAAAALTHEYPGVQLEIVTEATPLGRGGGLKFAAKHLPFGEPWFALNGDVITDLNLRAMASAHAAAGVLGTIALARYRLRHTRRKVAGSVTRREA